MTAARKIKKYSASCISRSNLSYRLRTWNRSPLADEPECGVCAEKGGTRLAIENMEEHRITPSGNMCRWHYWHLPDCTVDGCFEPAIEKGLCREHWIAEPENWKAELYELASALPCALGPAECIQTVDRGDCRGINKFQDLDNRYQGFESKIITKKKRSKEKMDYRITKINESFVKYTERELTKIKRLVEQIRAINAAIDELNRKDTSTLAKLKTQRDLAHQEILAIKSGALARQIQEDQYAAE